MEMSLYASIFTHTRGLMWTCSDRENGSLLSSGLWSSHYCGRYICLLQPNPNPTFWNKACKWSRNTPYASNSSSESHPRAVKDKGESLPYSWSNQPYDSTSRL